MKTDFQSRSKSRKTTPKSSSSVFLTFWHMCERRRRAKRDAKANSKVNSDPCGGSQLSSSVNWQSFDTSWCHTMRMFATRLGAFPIIAKLVSYQFFKHHARCLKITEKVSFNIASEASYVYILSGQKLIKNAQNCPFWRVFENLKLAVSQCYQTGQF